MIERGAPDGTAGRRAACRGVQFVVVVVCLVAVAAVAGPSSSAGTLVSAALKKAQQAAAQRDWLTTVSLLEEALLAARAESPLVITRAVVVNHDHTGLGLFTEARQDVVDGRRLRIYVEVDNLGLSPQSDGRVRQQLEVQGTFSYVEADGTRTALGSRPLGNHLADTHDRRARTSFGVDVKLGDKSPAGEYGVRLSVTDPIGGKSATHDVRFVLR